MNTLNDYFDQIYCLNLIERVDKWEAVNNEFEKNNIKNVKRIGINGKRIFKTGWNTHAGAYGCLMSNFLAILDAVEKNYDKILIFEDDVYFEENFNEKFWEKIDKLPEDWDLLYLGGNSQFGWGDFEVITGDKKIKLNKTNYNTLNNEIVKTKWTQCAPGIGYNKKILPDLVEQIKIWKHAYDILLPTLAKNNFLNAYIYFPTLVKPKACVNDVGGVYTDYMSHSVNNF